MPRHRDWTDKVHRQGAPVTTGVLRPVDNWSVATVTIPATNRAPKQRRFTTAAGHQRPVMAIEIRI